jgi:phosphoribosylamine-glycine ligase
MEGSKAFSKDFMKKHNIPTAAYEVKTRVQVMFHQGKCSNPIVFYIELY